MEAEIEDTAADEPIQLQTYVDVLTEASSGQIPNLNHWDFESGRHRAARELLRSGLLSDARVELGFGNPRITRRSAIVLSPEGALALIQWRDFLRENRPWVRFGRTLYQWLLVLIGAVAGGVAGVIATRIWPAE